MTLDQLLIIGRNWLHTHNEPADDWDDCDVVQSFCPQLLLEYPVLSDVPQNFRLGPDRDQPLVFCGVLRSEMKIRPPDGGWPHQNSVALFGHPSGWLRRYWRQILYRELHLPILGLPGDESVACVSFRTQGFDVRVGRRRVESYVHGLSGVDGFRDGRELDAALESLTAPLDAYFDGQPVRPEWEPPRRKRRSRKRKSQD